MNFIPISEAMRKGKGKVAVRGWVYRERGSNKLKFIVLRDSTNIIQCVLEKNKFEKQWQDIDKLQIESSIEIEGEIKEDKRAPTGFEIHATNFKLVGESNEFPINKDLNEELLGDRRHLWLRSRKMSSILKIRDTVLKSLREHWRSRGFYEFNTPSILGMQAEGGSTLFKVDYFGKPLYLCQTWQLHAETGIYALEKIFTIQPSFRAEQSKTSRHLTEYWHAEMEVAWAKFEELQDDAESAIKDVIKNVLAENKSELKILERDTKILESSLKKKFPRITYSDALKLLKEKKKMNISWGKDLRTIEEDKLSEIYDTPVIVSLYPKVVKAFYMKEADKHPKEGKVVLGFDVIAPESYGEIVGGSQREESIKKLTENLKEQGEDPSKYEFYFDSRRYGGVPHGGYGLGVERLLSWICKLETIKDASPFPRTMTRWYP
ncbi:MAG: asparagine--tRNA ligase [Nanoarchaeota archaeon]|nr:asparagine--tRNA ligase [Nanoarchaeota archaeon]MBU0978126.1 asparagine--tRNA ligase [Nanoarchaeota archaeon]